MSDPAAHIDAPRIIDLRSMRYRDALQLQRQWLETVMREREAAEQNGRPLARSPGVILLLEHSPPVVTITARQGAASHLVASPDILAHAGIEVEETDRGGDITYHGPGQLIAYPILDLNLLRLRLHDYMRLLEAAVIDTCASFAVPARRDPTATGVWVPKHPSGTDSNGALTDAKICALGVRIRRWVSMHGLALNVTTDLSHFAHIVPCGLAGRPVTSLQRELGAACPTMEAVKSRLAAALTSRIAEQLRTAGDKKPHARTTARP